MAMQTVLYLKVTLDNADNIVELKVSKFISMSTASNIQQSNQ